MAFLGMDVDEVRAVAERLREAQQRLAEQHDLLQGRITQSTEFWHGADADGFRGAWESDLGPLWRRAGEDLRRMAETADTDADQQDTTSGAEDRDPSGDGAGSEADVMPPSLADPSSTAGDEPLSKDLVGPWMDMGDDEKQAVLREIAEQELEQYGLEDVEIVFQNIPPEEGEDWYPAGSWNGEVLMLNTYGLHDPEMMLSAVHEARHAAQWEFVEQTQPERWDWLPLVDSQSEDYARIEEEHGVTREEIEAWRENQDTILDYGEDPEAYEAQPLEVDARESEDSFARGMSVEELQQYQRDAGVPVSQEHR